MTPMIADHFDMPDQGEKSEQGSDLWKEELEEVIENKIAEVVGRMQAGNGKYGNTICGAPFETAQDRQRSLFYALNELESVRQQLIQCGAEDIARLCDDAVNAGMYLWFDRRKGITK